MQRYTNQERIELVQWYFESNSSVVCVQRKFRTKYRNRPAPNSNTIRNIISKFSISGSVGDAYHIGRPRTCRLEENIARVRDDVRQRPQTSSRRRAQQFHISDRSIRRILKDDLHLYPYKIQITQSLLNTDHEKRLAWSNMLINLNNEINDFHTKIIMSDESHFHLCGYVNKQNSRFWGTENPRILHQKPLHSLKVTVWCGVYSAGILGPYFFENNAGNAVTVNADRYREMLRNFLGPQLEELNLRNMWFQQDGATSHTSRETINLLQTMFPDRLISRAGNIDWPPRSPDLTAPDCFLWGYLKDNVYKGKPETLEDLKREIRQKIADITPELLDTVMINVIKRAEYCRDNHGTHLKNIIFK